MHDRKPKVASCLSKVKAAMAAVLLLMVVGTGTALAQTSGRTITGKVLDEKKEAAREKETALSSVDKLLAQLEADQRERALLPVSPLLNSRTVRVSLEPGTAPTSVFTTANIASSLVIHDSTGQPWPITSVTNGGPSFFQVLRPELPDGNLLKIGRAHV